MKISAVTMRNVPTISLNSTLEEAGRLMRQAETGILPVVEDKLLVGTISQENLALHGCGAGLDPRNARVSVACDREEPVVCSEDMPLRSALELMRDRRIPWLVTVDRQRAVTGVVSLAELMGLLIDLVPEENDGPEPESVRQVRGESFPD